MTDHNPTFMSLFIQVTKHKVKDEYSLSPTIKWTKQIP